MQTGKFFYINRINRFITIRTQYNIVGMDGVSFAKFDMRRIFFRFSANVYTLALVLEFNAVLEAAHSKYLGDVTNGYLGQPKALDVQQL